MKKAGIIATYIHVPIASRIALFLSKTNITPNQITMLNLTFSMTASFLFLFGTNIYLIIGAFLIQFSYIFDLVDGKLARLKKMESKLGMFLDSIIDRISISSIIICLSIGSFIQIRNANYLVLCLFVILLFYLGEVVQFYLERIFYKKIRDVHSSTLLGLEKILLKIGINPKKIRIGYSEDIIWTVIFLGAITNLVYFMLLFFIFTNTLFLILTFYSMRKYIIEPEVIK